MSVLIPIIRDKDAWFDLQATLDGVTYTLEFKWNSVGEAWHMNVWDITGQRPHMLSIKLVSDYLIGQYISNRQPTGFWMLVDTGAPEGGGQDPGFDDLGNRHQLHYFPLNDFG